MTHNRTIKLVSMIIFGLTFAYICTGCGAYNKPQKEGDTLYNMQFPQSPQDYTSFLNKSIEPVTNQLVSQLMLMDKAAKGNYPIKDAISDAKASLSIVQDSIAAVEVMLPPDGYEKSRMETLRVMVNIENTLQAYIDELEKETLDKDAIQKLKEVMQADNTSLTSQFNVYWK